MMQLILKLIKTCRESQYSAFSARDMLLDFFSFFMSYVSACRISFSEGREVSGMLLSRVLFPSR